MSIDYEPYSEAAKADPHSFYRALRREAPVYWAEQAGAWVISRHRDVQFVFKHPELFSSDAMGGMLSGKAATTPASPALERNVIMMDPPHHAGVRNLVSRGFTPRRISALEPRLREIVECAMQKVRGASSFDVVAEFGVSVPVTIIAELLGVETERCADFKRWSDEIIASVSGSRRGEDGDSGAAEQFRVYFGELIEKRKREPREDLISVLVAAQDGVEALTHGEVLQFLLVLLMAGNETTTNLIGSMVQVLYKHPEQLELVVRDPALIPNLIEETLRYAPPVQFLFRRTRREVEIAGTELPANCAVIPLIASANRDERFFERPEEFDVTRDTQGHLTFGFGTHFCMGASLARLEARVVMEALLEELPRFRPCASSVEYVDSFMMSGPKRLVLERVGPAFVRGQTVESAGVAG